MVAGASPACHPTHHAVAEQLEAVACKATSGRCNSCRRVHSSGRKSAADSRAWNSEAAGASPAVLTSSGCEAHADEHRPDKSEVAGANPAAATKSRGRAWCAASLPTRHGTVRLRSPAPIRPGRRTGRRPSKPTTLVRVQLGAPYPRRWERRRFPKSPTVSSSLTAGAAKLTGISIPG